MAFLVNKEDESGVDKIHRGKPFLWVDMDFVRHGCRDHVPPGCAWRDINEKSLNCILLRARDVNNHHGKRNDFPSLAAGAMQKKWEEAKQKGVVHRPFLNFKAEEETKADADRWCVEHMLGSRTVADKEDGAQAQTAQEEIDQSPLKMLLDLVQASFHRDRAKKEKAKGFDLAKDQKRREDTERQLWVNIEREECLLDKASWQERAKKDAKASNARRISRIFAITIGSSFGKPHECGECGTSSHCQRTCWKLVDGRVGRRTRPTAPSAPKTSPC